MIKNETISLYYKETNNSQTLKSLMTDTLLNQEGLLIDEVSMCLTKPYQRDLCPSSKSKANSSDGLLFIVHNPSLSIVEETVLTFVSLANARIWRWDR